MSDNFKPSDLVGWLSDFLLFAANNTKGFWGFFIKIFIKGIIIPMVDKAAQNLANSEEGREKIKQLRAVLNNPEATNEDQLNAEDDFFTRG